MYYSEFCMVDYLEPQNAVLLTWKKFCKDEDYKAPVRHTLALLTLYKGSSLLIDTRNGFETIKENAAWGFSEFIPNLPQTGCSEVVFIVENPDKLSKETQIWGDKLAQYCKLFYVPSYDAAKIFLHQKDKALSMNVVYTVKQGCREAFWQQLHQHHIPADSRAERGNLAYSFYFSAEDANKLLLTEAWVNLQAQENHLCTPHYQTLQTLKAKYVEAVEICKYYDAV